MMKRNYVLPQAKEEAFMPTQNVCAVCTYHYASSTGNQYRCINPEHSHSTWYSDGEVIGYVFVEAVSTTCTMLVTSSTLKTQIVTGGTASMPANGATVYDGTGGAYICTERKVKDRNTFYIPANSENLCYGSYRFNGEYSDLMLKMHS